MPHRLSLLPGLLSMTVASAAAASGSATLEMATNAVLQTDGPRALALLQALEATTEAEGRKRDCVRARLEGRASFPAARLSGHPLPDAVLDAYRRYWRDALMPPRRAAAEAQLLRNLRRLLALKPRTPADDVLTALSERLEALGLHTSLGRTAGLYELMLYFREGERSYRVQLPDGHQETVRVFLMRDMVSAGWARHLNCGGPGTGGFATEQGLYAVADVYDLDSESFRINFLAHESQHYADYKRLPGLEGPELEFRAKLTELAQAEASLPETVQAFLANQGDDRGNPHGWANKRVLAAVVKELGLAAPADLLRAPPHDVREAARMVLLKDNAERGVAPAPR